MAVGRMTSNFNSDEEEWKTKGKCVNVEHHIFDELWNMGDKKIPEGVELDEDQVNKDLNGDEEQKDEQENTKGERLGEREGSPAA